MAREDARHSGGQIGRERRAARIEGFHLKAGKVGQFARGRIRHEHVTIEQLALNEFPGGREAVEVLFGVRNASKDVCLAIVRNDAARADDLSNG